MINNLLRKVFGSRNDRLIKQYSRAVRRINDHEPSIAALSDDELRAKTAAFRERVGNGEELDSILPEAFAVVREASKRVLGMRHFDVQLIGGMVLNDGKIAEMRTGEGKTLVATLPSYLNALTDNGVHIVTVNDYLARRDAEWMGRIHKFLGLTVGVILTQQPNSDKQAAYGSDITYGTNNVGEKLAKIAGLKPQELPAKDLGRGGAESSLPPRAWTIEEFAREVQALTRTIEERTDQLSVLEALLVQDSVNRKFLPSYTPVDSGQFTSNFGYRIDPFTGSQTFHEGIDFHGDRGTAVLAAASGKVVSAEWHAQYGKMIEIDHGNGLVSRYAHASRLDVKEGDLVVRGQKIAEIGSTGRSTGPHLHFEVRLNGVPQNPARFLRANG